LASAVASALVLIALLLPASAQCDWQGTKSNMSVAEVKRSVTIPVRDPSAAENRIWFGNKLAFTYSVGDLDFLGVFLFADDKLRGIQLKLSEPRKCAKLADLLKVHYGNPSTSWLNKGDNQFTWDDLAHQNRVELQYYEWDLILSVRSETLRVL